MGGIGTPASGFERGGIEEAVIYGDESLANAVSDLGEVAGPQPVRNQALGESRVSILYM